MPLAIKRLFDPLTLVGIAIDCTSVPVGVYSSINTGFPVLTSEPLPLPTRYTAILPGVNAAPCASAAKTKRTSANMRWVIDVMSVSI